MNTPSSPLCFSILSSNLWLIYVLAPGYFKASPWKLCFITNKSLEPCFGHIFFVLTPISAILALTQSLHHALHLFQLLQYCFYCFFTVSYLYCLFFLCDRVNDVPFEGELEQAYEEDFQQLAEEGMWPSPFAYSTLS